MMETSVPAIMVVRHKDAGWLNRRPWLGAGIARALVEKLRGVPFLRVYSLLATDQLLGSRGLAEYRPARPEQVSTLLDLPTEGILLGRVRVKAGECDISSYVARARGHEAAQWRGPYPELLNGINALFLKVLEICATWPNAAPVFPNDRRERVLRAGIPGSLGTFELLCQATHTRVGSERARLYRLAIAEDPSCAAAWSGLGTHLAMNGKIPEAVECFRKHTEVAPYDHDGYSSLGTAYTEMGQYDEAADMFRRAVDLYPQGDSDLFSNFGSMYHSMKRFDQAMTEYNRALSLNPCDPDIHFNLAKCYLARSFPNEPAEARHHLQQAIQLYGPLFAHKRRRAEGMLHALSPTG